MKSRNMRPRFSADDIGNVAMVDAVFVPKRFLCNTAGCVLGADGENLARSQFVHSMPLAARTAFRMCPRAPVVAARRPVFPAPVGMVVGNRAEKKVPRIDARWIIALMTDTESGRNRPLRNPPSDSVGAKRCARIGCPGTEAECAIVVAELARHPFPAFIRPANIDIRPKSGEVLRTQGRDDTVRSRHDSLQSRGLCSERLAALPAGRSLLRRAA